MHNDENEVKQRVAQIDDNANSETSVPYSTTISRRLALRRIGLAAGAISFAAILPGLVTERNVADANPFVAITALEALLASGDATTDEIHSALAGDDTIRTAVIVDILIHSGWLGNPANTAWIQRQILSRHSLAFTAGVVFALSATFGQFSDDQYNVVDNTIENCHEIFSAAKAVGKSYGEAAGELKDYQTGMKIILYTDFYGI